MDEETLREARDVIFFEQAEKRQRYAEVAEENRKLKALVRKLERRIEDLVDARDARKAKAEIAAGGGIPWEGLKAELGL